MDSAIKEDLGPLRAALERRLEELRSELRAAAHARLSEASPAAGEVTDRKDFAADSALANIAEEVEDLELEEQALVEAALRRLDQGGYGDCQDCGEPIALARLKVQPAAGRCAGCQAVHEGALEHRAPRHPR